MASFKYRVWAKVDLGKVNGWRPDVFVGLYELTARRGARPIAVGEFADDIVWLLPGDEGTVEAGEPHLGELMVLTIDGVSHVSTTVCTHLMFREKRLEH